MADYQKAIELSEEIADMAWDAFAMRMSCVKDIERAREKVRRESMLRALEHRAPHTIVVHGITVRARKI